jgi:hypothetical protein
LTPYQRKRKRGQRDNQRKFRARMREKGWTLTTFWIDQATWDRLGEHAKVLGVDRMAVARAALAVGLRHLRPSDIQRANLNWPCQTRSQVTAWLKTYLKWTNGKWKVAA